MTAKPRPGGGGGVIQRPGGGRQLFPRILYFPRHSKLKNFPFLLLMSIGGKP